MSNEYDISNAFNRIETKLIQSMKRNLSKHLEDETLENMNWSMWQTEQLKSLEQFRKENKSIFNDDFDNIDSDIESMLKESYNNASLEQEQKILEAIQKGVFTSTGDSTLSAGFFGLDSNKLTQLISETQGNIRKAETSILRYTNDQYRQIIFDAQVYANTGAGTIKQAVDMATQDFLSKGINSIQYSNGTRVNVSSYAEMAIRTANSRAHMYGEGEKRDEWGYHTVLVPNRNGGCPYCVQYQGKVFIDDVWSSGTKAESKGQGYPLLSTAVQGGLFHPNCKDTTVTYFPGINSNVKPPTQEEIKQKIENYNKEQKLKAIDRNIDKYKRLELGSLDESNIEKYHNKRLAWENYKKKFKENSNLSFNNKVTNSNNSSIIDKNESTNEIIETAKKRNITYNKVQKLEKNLTDEEIIQKISGGDETEKGSCSSVALSYIGNKNGLDVLDFRGGESSELFATRGAIQKISQLDGVTSYVEENYNDIKGVLNLLSKTEEGKEYYLSTGQHASIIKKVNGKIKYLELQSVDSNGYKDLTANVLKERFKCQQTHTLGGTKIKFRSTLIEIDSLKNNSEFEEMLGYINTAIYDQKKGIKGYAK